MKPLLSVICYNRRRETLATLEALVQTGAFEQAQVVVWDNASVDGTGQYLAEHWIEIRGADSTLVLEHENIGCPRALNQVLERYRQPGQHFIKVDNDVQVLTSGWVNHLCTFLDEHPVVAMASPWYRELETANQGRIGVRHDDWWQIFPVIGHCVIHRGELLDRTGFFDVLGAGHLYGFEDNLMAHRAGALGYRCAITLGVQLLNIQRKNSLDSTGHTGERRDVHVERLRPEYQWRVQMIHELGGNYYVTPDGRPHPAPVRTVSEGGARWLSTDEIDS